MRFCELPPPPPDEEPVEGGELLELVDETFFAVSAALLRTMRLIEDTEGRLSSSQIPSDCN